MKTNRIIPWRLCPTNESFFLSKYDIPFLLSTDKGEKNSENQSFNYCRIKLRIFQFLKLDNCVVISIL